MKLELVRLAIELQVRNEIFKKAIEDLTETLEEVSKITKRNTAKEKKKNNREFPYRKIERGKDEKRNKTKS